MKYINVKSVVSIFGLLLLFFTTMTGQDVAIGISDPIQDDTYSEGDTTDEQCYSVTAANGSDLIGADDLRLNLCTSKIVPSSVVITVVENGQDLPDLNFVQDGFAENCFVASLGDPTNDGSGDLPSLTNYTVCWTGVIAEASTTNSIGGKLQMTPSSTDTNSDNDVDEQYVSATPPAPVKLLFFTAKGKGIDSDLTWATASEENNSHFEVERSADGKTWNTIGEVKGNGTTSRKQEYAYTDKGIGKELSTVYYRLKQVDFDGAYEYTDIEVVNFERGKGTVSIYPNPVSEMLNFNVTVTDEYTVELYNVLGSMIAKTTKSTLDVTDFDSGSYIVKVKDQNGLELKSEKVVIIK